jgi:hypothetical protein
LLLLPIRFFDGILPPGRELARNFFCCLPLARDLVLPVPVEHHLYLMACASLGVLRISPAALVSHEAGEGGEKGGEGWHALNVGQHLARRPVRFTFAPVVMAAHNDHQGWLT